MSGVLCKSITEGGLTKHYVKQHAHMHNESDLDVGGDAGQYTGTGCGGTWGGNEKFFWWCLGGLAPLVTRGELPQGAYAHSGHILGEFLSSTKCLDPRGGDYNRS